MERRKVDENPYHEMIKRILRATERRASDTKDLLDMFTELVASISKIIEQVNKVNSDYSFITSRENTTTFFKEFIQYISENVIDIHGLNNFKLAIIESINSPLSNFYTRAQEKCRAFQMSFNQAEIALDIGEGQYKKAYQEYEAACAELEAELDPYKSEQLIQKCQREEIAALNACKTLSNVRRSYCLEVEKVFYSFELLEKDYYNLIDATIGTLNSVISNLATMYITKSESAAEKIEKIVEEDEDEAIVENLKRVISHNCDTAVKQVELQFNIFDLLSPKIVYEKMLKCEVCVAVEPYENPQEAGLVVAIGDLVEVRERNKKFLTVELLSNGVVGKIEPSYFGPSSFTRTICKLKSDFGYALINYRPGFYFCIVNEYPNCFRCKTPSGSFVNVPKNLVELTVV